LKLRLAGFDSGKTDIACEGFLSIDENTLNDKYEYDKWAEGLYEETKTEVPERPSDILKRTLNALSDSVL